VLLRYNVALKFDASFSVLVFPPDVGQRFARFDYPCPKRGTPLRRRLGVNQVPHGCTDEKAMGFEDDLHRIDEHLRTSHGAAPEGSHNPFASRGREHMGCSKDTLAARIQSTAIGGTLGPAQGKRLCSGQE
jgi:hypothetical protein